jgi:uncharacterized glyoxalase superfamily protein PhnB
VVVATVAGMSAAGINTTQVVTPYVFYENVGQAIDWLVRVLGFQERIRLGLAGGFVAHAEVGMGDGVVMIGNVGARNAGPRPSNVRSSVYVFVDDVDAHFEHARSCGAEIIDEPADQPFGDRIYLVRDPEGHEWYIAQHLRDVPLDELRRRLGG